MKTPAQRERTQLRKKLYTGRMIPANGRGGLAIPESSPDGARPGLVQLWPTYLDSERAAARPTLTMVGVSGMLDQEQTPAFKGFTPRMLSSGEVAVISTWHQTVHQQEKENLADALAAARTRNRIEAGRKVKKITKDGMRRMFARPGHRKRAHEEEADRRMRMLSFIYQDLEDPNDFGRCCYALERLTAVEPTVQELQDSRIGSRFRQLRDQAKGVDSPLAPFIRCVDEFLMQVLAEHWN